MKKIQTEVEEYKVGDFHIRMHVVSNTEELMDDLIQTEAGGGGSQDEGIPYWADLWPSSIGLARYLVRTRPVKENMRVLEIGCGLGLAGIVAGKLGGRLIFTDYLPEALEYARKNWELNHDASAGFSLMNWREPNLSFHPELILASDIAYERKSFPELIRAFQLLSGPGVKILISEPNRAFSQEFFTAMKENGFIINSSAELISFRGIDYTIRTHEIVSA